MIAIIDKDNVTWKKNLKTGKYSSTQEGVYTTADKNANTGEFENREDELWDADSECEHEIVSASGGGVRCTKCRGWCCF